MKNPMQYMELECDILIPAANDKAIHKDNAANIKCKIVVEGANGPTTFIADEILNEKGIIVVPDILINTGGVTCSYFEWLKNIDHVSPELLKKRYKLKSQLLILEKMGITITKNSPMYKRLEGAGEIDVIYTCLEQFMTDSVKNSWNFSQKSNLKLRDACLTRALYKVYNHYELAGMMF